MAIHLLLNLQKSILTNEQLGTDGETDLLAISYSATDYIGHGYGS
jgi:hypothetical protein